MGLRHTKACDLIYGAPTVSWDEPSAKGRSSAAPKSGRTNKVTPDWGLTLTQCQAVHSQRMLSIGDFARHGRVSVRMLRRYDAIGLLRPVHVDGMTGYRSYDAGQLSRLNLIVALQGLGFTLEQVRLILDDEVSVEELNGMLRLRGAELQSQIAADTARLAQVEARLRIIESEGAMPTDDVQIKRIPAVRVAELTATAASFEAGSIAPVIGPLYDALRARLGRAGLKATGPDVAYYENPLDGEGVLVHAAIPVDTDPSEDYDFAVVDLPEIDQ